ncbi:iron-siderophore ABC transporter substrate-binding protein [Lacisediminihabitans sp. FW035]
MSLLSHPRARPVIVSTAAAGLIVGLLSGCSSTAPQADTASSAGFPVTIASTHGSAIIDTTPKRVATVSWTNQDVAIALGVIPTTMAFANYGDDDTDGYLPWTYDALKKRGATMPPLHDETDGIPFEKISDARPDVILGAYSGLSKEDFDTLQKIAPTVSYPDKPWSTSWKDTTRIDAKALGKTAEAETRIAEVEKQIASEVAKHPQLAGKTFAYLSITSANPDAITYYTPNDARVKFVTELGLKNSPTVTKLSSGSSEFYGTISAENADTIDADIVILYLDDDSSLDAIKDSALLSLIPAIRRGSVVSMIDQPFIMSTSAPSLLSIPWSIEKYTSLIAAAADRV